MTAARTATVTETAKVAGGVLLPTLAGGVIKRRPAVMQLAQRLQLDRPSVRVVTQLRDKYDGRPLRLRVPGRSVALALSADDVGTVLAGAPIPFSPSTVEKRAALGHFQPHGVLVSPPEQREQRRRFNEEVLEPGHALHELAGPFAEAVAEEAGRLRESPVLDWDRFARSWWRLVRRQVLGASARDDDRVTDLLARLRLDANWAYLHPRRDDARREFTQRLQAHLDRAEPGSLAATIAEVDGTTPAADQVAHWLFAYDAAAIVTFRTLALLASHPEAARTARADQSPELQFLRACALESVRLWPTTPMLLRETTEQTEWGRAGTTILVFTPFFHRDPTRMSYADSFVPSIWLDGRAAAQPALVPFSAGPAICPGRDLVLFTVSTLLAELLRDRDYRLSGAELSGAELSGAGLSGAGPLPASLDPFHLRFTTHTPEQEGPPP
ncbi:cytochrome P450 [Amycolatopsis jiangsuensis]|uniref:Cytochrome P450 n=1 Tax=Amycolatopsis jiangsuensis TaxID=1181879 RepID=A0A840J6D7_9PSEU|nr:cytochrome P450 [Amycolatopsis jiangsuensis]MBB4689165.1 cytochrome P450 [Amycolatopsis jiangsuensis]